MKEKQEARTEVGVIVGRFQVDNLTNGHIDLIKSVLNRHDRTILFLGLSPLKCTKNNPLDFEARKKMILNSFPEMEIHYVKDQMQDDVWSNLLDERIKDLLGPRHKATLYGSRDSFIRHYDGAFKTVELVPSVITSGSNVRNRISNKVKTSDDFRAGVIWATQNQYPTSYTTVDVAIYNEDYSRLLLGRKKNEDQYRFIGGFVNAGERHETSARREVKEETGVEITDLNWVCSLPIDDWRYRGESDKITTVLFTAKIMFGDPKPNDDIFELKWFDVEKINEDDLVPNHRIILLKLAGTKKPSINVTEV